MRSPHGERVDDPALGEKVLKQRIFPAPGAVGVPVDDPALGEKVLKFVTLIPIEVPNK